MSLGPHIAPRTNDDLGRWRRHVDDELRLLRSLRGLLERGSVNGGQVTIREILVDPGGQVQMWNRDFVHAAADDVDVPVPTTYAWSANSMLVKQNGVDLLYPQWAEDISGRLVTVDASMVTVREDDLFQLYYKIDPTVPVPPTPEVFPIELVGATTANYADSDIDMPTGVQDGDLLVLAMNSYGAPTFSDARFTSTPYSAVKSGVIYQSIHVGTADGTGAAIPLTLGSFSGTQGFATLSVFRNAAIGTPVVKDGLAADYPYNLPAATATEALAVLLPSYATVPGSSAADSTGDWDLVAQAGSGWDVSVHHLPAVTSPISTPPGSFGYSGIPGNYTAIVIPLEAP